MKLTKGRGWVALGRRTVLPGFLYGRGKKTITSHLLMLGAGLGDVLEPQDLMRPVSIK